MNALRLREGFERAQFESRTALAWPAVTATLERARADGLLQCAGERWRTTPLGERFLNDLLQRFLP